MDIFFREDHVCEDKLPVVEIAKVKEEIRKVDFVSDWAPNTAVA